MLKVRRRRAAVKDGGRRAAAGGVCLVAPPTLITCCIVVTLLAQCGASATPNHWPCCPKARRRDLCASWGGTCLLVGVGFGLAIGMVAWHAWWGGVHARDAGGRRRPAGERHGMEGSVGLRPDLRSMRQAGRQAGASCARRRRPLQPSQSPSGGADRKQWERTAAAARGKETGRRRNGDSLLSLSLSVGVCDRIGRTCLC